jgi:Holliday junction resolvase RusA-like endonuclease
MISFNIFGEPYPKGRPKARVRGQHAQIYTPPETRAATDNFQAQALKYKPETPLKGPLIVQITYLKKKPESYTKKHNDWDKKPDLDNLAKLTLDAMNGIFFYDDAQIVKLILEKGFDDKPRTFVAIMQKGEAPC